MSEQDPGTAVYAEEDRLIDGEGHGEKVEDSERRKRAWGRYGRRPLVLLALVGFVDSVDKGILPGVLSQVQAELGFSDTQAGILGSVFILMGFLAVIPAGYIADRYRRNSVIAVVLASWGAISALNAGVQNFWQFLVVRSTLGISNTIAEPASASLLADYYPVELRGRAYAIQRIAPILGTALGVALGGAVAALLGWRAAFLIVGVPGSLLAFWIWRLPEPRRGESDVNPGKDGGETEAGAESPQERDSGAFVELVGRNGFRGLWDDLRVVGQVPTLWALMIGLAMSQGATAGFGFWAAVFYERHTELSVGGATATVGALILFGAAAGTIVGGIVNDRLRRWDPSAPMLLAGSTQLMASALLAVSFMPVALPIRMGTQFFGVATLLAGFPALTAMISEVVPGRVRGIAFSLLAFVGQLAAAASPLVIGIIADQFAFAVEGEVKGDLAKAFLSVTPLIALGALIVLWGRRYARHDTERVSLLEVQLVNARQSSAK